MCMLAFAAVLHLGDSLRMSCGGGLCGVLVLETGQGQGYYQHSKPSVHGLWPEVAPYGDSKCVAPGSWLSSALPSCYEEPAQQAHQAQFVQHEWQKHGSCAGVTSEQDYFQQVCSLSQAPLKVMTEAISANGDVEAAASALRAAGFPVIQVDGTNSQVMLSACAAAGTTGYSWIIAPVEKFPELCGSQPPTPPAPVPTPAPDMRVCVRGRRGPECSSDGECQLSGCLRCAHSGFCTDQPLSLWL